MLRIPCPFCGERDHHEFAYGGDATVRRPALDERDAESWYRYVFVRANPKGAHRELWQHVSGCRAWIVVERDTLTHAITGGRLARAAASESSDGQA